MLLTFLSSAAMSRLSSQRRQIPAHGFPNSAIRHWLRGPRQNDELALAVWSRPGIPREHLLTLFATASEAVRLKLEVSDRSRAALVREIVKQASDRIQTKVRERSPGFAAAQAYVKSLHRTGELTEARLCEFAKAGKFDETTVALSLLGDLPIGAVERALVHENTDQMLLLAKSMDLTWNTTSAILLMQGDTKSRSSRELEHSLASFKKLKPETARTAIQFYRLRARAAKASLS